MTKVIRIVTILVLLVVLGSALWVGFMADRNNVNEEVAPLKTANLQVNVPLPGSTVQSPLYVEGQAVGNWYFEAVFPIKITDANGNILGQTTAHAQGDWTTTNFVPFKATLNFVTSTTPNGFLVLKNDNPSGLPQKDEIVELPIKFSNSN